MHRYLKKIYRLKKSEFIILIIGFTLLIGKITSNKIVQDVDNIISKEVVGVIETIPYLTDLYYLILPTAVLSYLIHTYLKITNIRNNENKFISDIMISDKEMLDYIWELIKDREGAVSIIFIDLNTFVIIVNWETQEGWCHDNIVKHNLFYQNDYHHVLDLWKIYTRTSHYMTESNGRWHWQQLMKYYTPLNIQLLKHEYIAEFINGFREHYFNTCKLIGKRETISIFNRYSNVNKFNAREF